MTGIGYLSRLLAANGIEVIGAGPEGTLRAGSSDDGVGDVKPFFRGRYLGLECVSEWHGVRASH